MVSLGNVPPEQLSLGLVTPYNAKQGKHRPGYQAEYDAGHRTEHAEYMREYRQAAAESRVIVGIDGEGENTGKIYYHGRKDNGSGTEILFIGSETDKPPFPKTLFHKMTPGTYDPFWRAKDLYKMGVWLAKEHIYTLLAASTGQSISNKTGLSTTDCLDFLLSLWQKDALFVSFAFSYDVNMMLGNLPEKALKQLAKTTTVQWGKYRISWIPRKTFSVTADKRTVTVWDTFGYFQKSFVDSLDEWAVGSPETRKQIRDMKAQRGAFASVESDDIAAYCADECRLLVQLVEKTLATVEKLNIRLRRYDGAGSIAAAIMDKYDVATYLQSNPADENRGLAAYYGGRFELARPGEFDKLWQYDINSAYPAALYQLPCLTHGTWTREYRWNGEPGLVKVQWDIGTNLPHKNEFMPFPYRIPRGTSKGEIVYPIRGAGWYWSHEIAAAMLAFPDRITALEARIYRQECEHRPFAHILDLYETRKTLKYSGDLGHLILKLGYNSEYGKTAQSIGYQGRKPKYRNWLAASFITSWCRARILDAIRLGAGNVIEIATDGVLTTSPIDGLPISKALGEWDISTLSNCLLVRPNLYLSDNKIKASGLAKDELEPEAIRRNFRMFGPTAEIMATTRRFMGLDIALTRNALATGWRCWCTDHKRVRPEQHNRLYSNEQTKIGKEYRTLDTEPFSGIFEDSSPYLFKRDWADSFESHVMSDWLNQP